MWRPIGACLGYASASPPRRARRRQAWPSPTPADGSRPTQEGAMNREASPTDIASELQSAAPRFHIPAATSLQERRFRTLKHGDTFAMFNYNGDALTGPTRPDGIYHRDTRHLDRLELSV